MPIYILQKTQKRKRVSTVLSDLLSVFGRTVSQATGTLRKRLHMFVLVVFLIQFTG